MGLYGNVQGCRSLYGGCMGLYGGVLGCVDCRGMYGTLWGVGFVCLLFGL